jgi:hypothetical protein
MVVMQKMSDPTPETKVAFSEYKASIAKGEVGM